MVGDELRAGPLAGLSPLEQEIFLDRLELFRDDAVRPLARLYGRRADFESWIERLFAIAARGYAERAPELRRLDLARGLRPDWFQRPEMLGYVCYVDRFAGDLRGVEAKIPYLEELGITFLHLMPLLESRPGENDGGYAVADYRRVEPRLGTMDDLARLAAALRRRGISLCVDLVCNHTAREHPWARRALAGDRRYQGYYHLFPDRALPDRYEETLREIFPAFAPGSFTYVAELDRWAWTTFHEYQWDLDYGNPAVFAEMLDNILFLANRGVEVLRLDAVAFLWKRLGTDCENQPEAHWLLQGFRALSRIAAPGLLHLAEAIVPWPHLVPYLGVGAAAGRECELAYHHVLMVMLWSSLAEGKVALMTHTLRQLSAPAGGTAWLTYARCHDDIGWAVTGEDAAAVDLDGGLHREFLADFYGGRFLGSFARGSTFQPNPATGDRRTNGTLASLAGLEAALAGGGPDPRELDLAVRRILLLHSMIFAFGGIPLIYMGDEIGLLNDPGYRSDPHRAGDGRWLHRPPMDWRRAAERRDPDTVAGRIFGGLRELVEARRRSSALHAQARTAAVWTDNEHVAGLVRESARGRILVLGNFSRERRSVSALRLRDLGFEPPLHDRLGRRPRGTGRGIDLEPYESVWLEKP